MYTKTWQTLCLLIILPSLVSASIVWTESNVTGDVDEDWEAVASDSDGSHLIAAVGDGRLFTSSDSGATWTERQPAGDSDKDWVSVASDADGSHLMAGVNGGRLYIGVETQTKEYTNSIVVGWNLIGLPLQTA